MITLAARLLSFAPAVCSVACVGTGPSSSGTLVTKVADGRSVAVSIENGRVEFIKDPAADGVEISAAVRCYGKDQAEADARLQSTSLVAKSDSEGKVEVSVSIPRRGGGGWTNLNSDVTHITVRAADLSGIVATTSNGSISLGAFEGEAKLRTSNGRIAVDGHRGAVNAETSNGSIDIKGATSVVAETSNGSIKVVLADDATGGLRLETSNGSVTVDLPATWEGTVAAGTSVGSIDLSGGEVKGKGDSKTMTVGDATKATATIETSVGSVTVRPAKQ